MIAITRLWGVVSGSVRGSLHHGRGLPNQDAVASTVVDDALVVAVSDGHGGDRYIRSDRGSRFAVEAACRTVAALHEAGIPHSRGGTLADRIVATWRRFVEADLEADPFDDVERGKLDGLDPDADPYVSYGATLLLAVADAESIVFLQLGDGDITTMSDSGEVSNPMPDDDRLVGGQTTSLCVAGAVDDFRMCVVPSTPAPALVVLSTDGYGNSFAASDWRESMAADLRRHVGASGLADVDARLPSWLAESATAAGDDVTVAVLSPTSGVGTATQSPTTRRSDARPAPRAIAMVALAAMLSLVAGLAVGWLLWDDSEGPRSATEQQAPTSIVSTTLTTAPPPSQGPPLEHVIGPRGAIIEFTPTLDDTDAKVIGTGPAALSTAISIDGVEWALDDGVLSVSDSDGTQEVSLDGIVGTSLAYLGEHIWIVDDAESRLVVVDPVTREVAGVKRVSRPQDPAQQPTSANIQSRGATAE